MSFTIKHPVFVHDFLNPPSEDRSCDISLDIINSSGVITLTKEGAGLQTQYLLTVSDPSCIFLSSSDQMIIERTIKELTLAFNLCLSRTCLSTLKGELASADVHMQLPETKVTIEQTPVGKNVTIVETVLARDTFHLQIRTSENLDEKEALATLEKVYRVNRFGLQPTSPVKRINVSKALNEYEAAMSSFDRLRIFKSLFSSLEFSVNWNGNEYKGSNFDSRAASMVGIQQTDLEKWRLFFNRTKHADRTPDDASQFLQGTEQLSSILPSIREAAKKSIIDKLYIRA